jgi:predicted permease
MGSGLTDLRLAVRGFLRTPAFTGIAVLSIALGIGASTAVFTLVDRVLLRTLPVRDPDQLVQATLDGSHYGSNWGDDSELSYPWYRELAADNQVFDGVFGRFAYDMSLGAGGRTDRVRGEIVTGSYFPVLGVKPALGRLLSPEDDRVRGGHPVAVLSHGYWISRFGGDPSVLNRPVVVNGRSYTVIGVAAAGFAGDELGRLTDVFVPMMMKKEITPSWDALDERLYRWVRVFARLKPGVTRDQAQAALGSWLRGRLDADLATKDFANASADTRAEYARSHLVLEPAARGRSGFRRAIETPLLVLMGISVGVLIIACANVANLLVARAAARQREMALRVALGAGRARLVRQLLVESVLLAAGGGVAGLVLSVWAAPLILGFFTTSDSPQPVSTTPDWRIFLFALAASTITGVVFGLVPALRATSVEVTPSLKAESGSVAGGHARLRKALVASQVALSLLLLIGAGLFIRTLRNLAHVDVGIRTSQLFAFDVDPPRNGYTTEQTRQFARSLVERLSSEPGVSSVALSTQRILQGNQWSGGFTVEGSAAVARDDSRARCNTVSPGYFQTMGVPLVAGREFERRDVRPVDAAESVGFFHAIVNESFAKKYFPNGNAVGRHLGFGTDPGTKTDIEIVGVVKDFKYIDVRSEPGRQVFFPYFEEAHGPGFTAYVRTRQDLTTAFAQARRTVAALDANIPISDVWSLDREMEQSVGSERMMATMSTLFGLLATALAVVGLYGVMAFTVTRRTREIGVRMALGAQSSEVGRMVIREALTVAVIGTLAALPLVWWLSRFVQSQLFGVEALDATTIAVAALALIAVASLSAVAPMRRATRVNPVTALRYE